MRSGMRVFQKEHGRIGSRLCWAGVSRSLAAIALLAGVPHARAEDTSAPAMLQMFEASWSTIENRMPDIFQTGYGQMWLPPPERADSGGLSVGYDVSNRFDLGAPRNETLYGTENGLKSVVAVGHQAGLSMYTDFVANHNGYETQSNST